MTNLIDYVYENVVRNQPFAMGSGISLFRNPILATIELGSGINPNISANLRMFATGTNFILGDPIAKIKRNIEKKLGIGAGSTKETRIWLNRLYGASLASIGIVADYGLYKLFGAENM